MIRTEEDIAATLATAADIVVDTDALVATIKRRARARRRLHLTVAGGATAALAIGIGVPVALHVNPLGTDGNAPPAAPTGPVGGWATLPRTFTGDCTVGTMPTPVDVEPGHPIMVTNADPTGRFVVGTYGPPIRPDNSWSNSDGITGRVLPVRWYDGIGRVIPVAGEDLRDVQPTAVNRHGVVVGQLTRVGTSPGMFVAWVSMDGTDWSLLPTPAGYDDAYAIAITDQNEILGGVYGRDGRDAIVWSAGENGQWTWRVIDTPSLGWVAGIADNGLVVGTLFPEQPYRWRPDGTREALPMPDGTTWGRIERVRGDWAVGFAGVASDPPSLQVTHVVRWNLQTGEMSIVASLPYEGWHVAVNARGDVVWHRGSEVVLTRDGREYVLPIPPVEASPLGNLGPVAINDDATLVLGNAVIWWC